MPPRPALLAACAALALVAAGCGGAAPRSEVGITPGALSAHLSRLAAPVAPGDTVAAARRTLYAVERLRRWEVQPAFPPSFLLAHAPGGVDPAAAHVLGYVAGRNPNHAAELVLLTAPLDGAAAAAALEATRLLAEAARQEVRPEATVGLLLYGPPRTGPVGVEDFLRRPPWALAGIVRVLVLGEEPARARAEAARWAEAGIPAEVVVGSAGDAQGATLRLAEAAFRRADAAAARGFTASADTLR